MSKNNKASCSSCGRKQRLIDYNYAGVTVDINNTYSFPFRINFPTIPGGNSKDFLCSTCINKNYKVSCSEHGVLKDIYEYGNPPRCYKCEKDLSDLKNGILPTGFKAFVTLSKLSIGGKSTDKNILLAITKNDDICLIEKKVLFFNSIKNFYFYVEDENLIGKKASDSNTPSYSLSFEINYKDPETFRKDKGNWIFPWFKEIRKRIASSNRAELFFSDLEYYEVNNDDLLSKPKKLCSIFWTANDENINIFDEKLNFPSLDTVVNWSLDFISFPGELKILFKLSNIPSLLIIKEINLVDGINRIDSLKLPLDKKIDSHNLTFPNRIGIFEFRSDKGNIEKYLIDDKSLHILATNLSNGVSIKYEQGCIYNNYLLLCNKTSFIVSKDRNYQFNDFLDSTNTPVFPKTIENVFNVILFDYNNPGDVILLDFFKEGFSINKELIVNYKEVLYNNILREDKGSILTIKFITEGREGQIALFGPSKYMDSLCSLLDIRKAKSGLNTLELYETYNKKQKKQSPDRIIVRFTAFG
jgi:hypothetical protein